MAKAATSNAGAKSVRFINVLHGVLRCGTEDEHHGGVQK
jgi:hypothetical protein